MDRPIVNSTNIPLALLEAVVASSDLFQASDSGAQAGGAAATGSIFFSCHRSEALRGTVEDMPRLL